MIKRRKDYEAYLRMREDWHQAYHVGGSIYRVYVILHPEFIKFWLTWKGRRLRVLWLYIRQMVENVGPARTTKELQAEADEFNAGWRKMVAAGAIEAAVI